MKAYILIVQMAMNSDNPTVAMQRMESLSACNDAIAAVTQTCTTIPIDGGEFPMCLQMQNIQAKCIPAR
jgi:hypothetical protein